VQAADLADGAATREAVAAAIQELGGLDVVVYAAGTNIPRRALTVLDPAEWDMMLAANLSGAFHVTQAALPHLRAQGHGLLIYLSSGAVQKPDVSGVAYQATKHGLVGLAHGTREEEREHGIRTTVIFPGLTETPLLNKRPAPTPPEVVAKALQPEDVAQACLFVASLPPRARVPELQIFPAGL
jgi:NAD(P)-dependent dehydrogenase (short-subunit alcohol dehydrogenase family)